MSNVFGTCFNLFDTRYGDTLENQSQSPSPSIDGTIEHTNHKHATPMILDVLNEPQSLQTPNASDSKCGEESTEDIDTEMFLASHPPTPLNSNINYNTDKYIGISIHCLVICMSNKAKFGSIWTRLMIIFQISI
eukprot:676799_1